MDDASLSQAPKAKTYNPCCYQMAIDIKTLENKAPNIRKCIRMLTILCTTIQEKAGELMG